MADGVATQPQYDIAAKRRMYEESQTLTREGRLSQQKDGDYYDGVQLTRDEKRILRGRKQPDNIWNFTRLAVNGTLGVMKQGATDPRAYPRNPQDEDSADVASKTLRYIADASNFDALKLDVAKDYLVPGTGAAIIEIDDDRRPIVTQIRWEEFFYDPRSRRQDFSDARFMGIAKWWWADDVKAEYPDKANGVDTCLSGSGPGFFDDLNDDRPSDGGRTVAWADKRQKRIMVVEMYYREGQTWKRCKFHASEVLEEGDSPYLDDKKRPSCPIEAQSCYVDRENNRVGMVRDLRGPQDEVNKRSSKLLFELTARQIQEASPGSGMGDADTARKEAARPDGVIPSGWQVVPRQDVVSGQERLLQNAIQAMSRFSPNPAILGREGENQSGRSNLIRQQAGLTEQAVIYGGIEEWELRCYRQMWNRARQYMTAPDFIRVTDEEGSPEFVGINQVPSMEMQGPDGQAQKVPGQPMADPNAQPNEQGQVPQLMEQGKPAFLMPDGSKALGYENSLGELDVDITIDTTPDTANVQAEQFALLIELGKMYGPEEVPFEDVVKLSSLQGKREYLDARKTRAEEGQQGQQNSPQAQLALEGAMAELEKLKAEVDKIKADTQLALAKAESEAVKPHIEAAQIMQAGDQHAIGLEHEARMQGAELAHAGDMRGMELEHDAAKTAASMEQSDQQFNAGMDSQERLAAMKPPPGQ